VSGSRTGLARKCWIGLARHAGPPHAAGDDVVATIQSCTLDGIDAELIDVECSIDRGLPQYSVVGLPALSVRKGATRIQSALKTVGYDLPLMKVTRTITDLVGQDDIDPGCLLEAAAYRDVDPTSRLASQFA
jgi:hypothetical protein